MKRMIGLITLLAAGVHALPPPVPSAGIVERELEREYEARPLELDKPTPDIQIDIPEEKLSIPEGQKIYIKDVILRGNESISTKDIQSWIAPYLDQELSIKDIYELCHVIDVNYAERGYFLARAYPPPQTIENQTLTIEIIEGKLGNISVIGNRYYTKEFILGYFKHLVDCPLKYEKFLHALMLLNDNSDLEAGVLFEKGEEFGHADVIVRVHDERPTHLYLNGNNYGRNLTTNTRAGGRFDYGNLFAQGDMFSLAEVVGFPFNALYFTDLTYTVPLNKRGASLELAYLFSKFKIEELTSLHLKGKSQIGTIKFNQAWIRRRHLNVDLFTYFDIKQIQNYAMGSLTSFDKLRVLTVGALLDHASAANGRDYLNMTVSAGIPDFLGGLKAVDSHCSRPGAGGRFFILNVDYDRLQQLPRSCYFYFHGSMQLTPNKLTIPEQIYIGGDNTVRGFPLAVALGDNGYYLNFEMRVPPPFFGNKRVFKWNKTWKEILQFDAFLDHGGVFLQSFQNTFLWGTGLGARLNLPYNFNFSIDVGIPLNHDSLTRDVFTYIKLTCQAF